MGGAMSEFFAHLSERVAAWGTGLAVGAMAALSLLLPALWAWLRDTLLRGKKRPAGLPKGPTLLLVALLLGVVLAIVAVWTTAAGQPDPLVTWVFGPDGAATPPPEAPAHQRLVRLLAVFAVAEAAFVVCYFVGAWLAHLLSQAEGPWWPGWFRLWGHRPRAVVNPKIVSTRYLDALGRVRLTRAEVFAPPQLIWCQFHKATRRAYVSVAFVLTGVVGTAVWHYLAGQTAWDATLVVSSLVLLQGMWFNRIFTGARPGEDVEEQEEHEEVDELEDRSPPLDPDELGEFITSTGCEIVGGFLTEPAHEPVEVHPIENAILRSVLQAVAEEMRSRAAERVAARLSKPHASAPAVAPPTVARSSSPSAFREGELALTSAQRGFLARVLELAHETAVEKPTIQWDPDRALPPAPRPLVLVDGRGMGRSTALWTAVLVRVVSCLESAVLVCRDEDVEDVAERLRGVAKQTGWSAVLEVQGPEALDNIRAGQPPPQVACLRVCDVDALLRSQKAPLRHFVELVGTVAIDDLHLYAGRPGAHLAYLLRRWNARLRAVQAARPGLARLATAIPTMPGNGAELWKAFFGEAVEIYSDTSMNLPPGTLVAVVATRGLAGWEPAPASARSDIADWLRERCNEGELWTGDLDALIYPSGLFGNPGSGAVEPEQGIALHPDLREYPVVALECPAGAVPALTRILRGVGLKRRASRIPLWVVFPMPAARSFSNAEHKFLDELAAGALATDQPIAAVVDDAWRKAVGDGGPVRPRVPLPLADRGAAQLHLTLALRSEWVHEHDIEGFFVDPFGHRDLAPSFEDEASIEVDRRRTPELGSDKFVTYTWRRANPTLLGSAPYKTLGAFTGPTAHHVELFEPDGGSPDTIDGQLAPWLLIPGRSFRWRGRLWEIESTVDATRRRATVRSWRRASRVWVEWAPFTLSAIHGVTRSKRGRFVEAQVEWPGLPPAELRWGLAGVAGDLDIETLVYEHGVHRRPTASGLGQIETQAVWFSCASDAHRDYLVDIVVDLLATAYPYHRPFVGLFWGDRIENPRGIKVLQRYNPDVLIVDLHPGGCGFSMDLCDNVLEDVLL